jgi:hypothetical protein
VPERPRDPVARVFCIPWAHPGPHALFQIRHDLVGNFAVDVGAVCRGLCHLRSSFEAEEQRLLFLWPSPRPGCANERGFRRDPAARSRSACGGGGSWVESPLKCAEGQAPKPRRGQAASAAMTHFARGIVTRMCRDASLRLGAGPRARSIRTRPRREL